MAKLEQTLLVALDEPTLERLAQLWRDVTAERVQKQAEPADPTAQRYGRIVDESIFRAALREIRDGAWGCARDCSNHAAEVLAKAARLTRETPGQQAKAERDRLAARVRELEAYNAAHFPTCIHPATTAPTEGADQVLVDRRELEALRASARAKWRHFRTYDIETRTSMLKDDGPWAVFRHGAGIIGPNGEVPEWLEGGE